MGANLSGEMAETCSCNVLCSCWYGVPVGEVGEIRSEVLKNEAGTPQSLHHAGFAVAFQFDNEAFDIAPSGTRWSDPDMPHSFETKSGARANWH